jgi:hypothetical protein
VITNFDENLIPSKLRRGVERCISIPETTSNENSIPGDSTFSDYSDRLLGARPEGAKPKIAYAPTDREQAAIDRVRRAGRGPRIKVEKSGDRSVIAPDHVDVGTDYCLLMEALGTTDDDFLIGLLGRLTDAGSQGRKAYPEGINFMISVIKGIQPRDQVEAMLASQMAAVHMASMAFARRLAHVKDIRQQDSAERAFNQLTRTFAAQMEALKRYRTGGEQKVTVQHVTVGDGGQAIVGNVTHGSRRSGREQVRCFTTAPRRRKDRSDANHR